MTSSAQAVSEERYDVRTIVLGGVKLGAITALGVVAFALLSRALPTGGVETVVQSVLVLAGGAVCSFLPAWWVRPRTIDAVGWAAMLGLIGALVFTVIDTALLRPMKLYHWSWDAIGGGSGFWYIPVWWMGSALLASLGAALVSRGGGDQKVARTGALHTVALAVLVFAVISLSGLAAFHPAVAALAFLLALVLYLPIRARSASR